MRFGTRRKAGRGALWGPLLVDADALPAGTGFLVWLLLPCLAFQRSQASSGAAVFIAPKARPACSQSPVVLAGSGAPGLKAPQGKRQRPPFVARAPCAETLDEIEPKVSLNAFVAR